MMAAMLTCLLFNITCPYTESSQPVIAVSPQEFDVGLKEPLDVNCTVSAAGWSTVAALISLTISRNNSRTGWTELAIISDFFNEEVNVMTTENVTASGWFNASGSASVSLHWNYPTDQQAGNYICSAQGFNSVGQTLVNHSSVQVSTHTPELSDVQDMLKLIDIQMNQSQSQIQTLNLEVMALKKEKETRISKMFEASFKYKNHIYYVSRDAIYNVYVSQSICRIFGGYLAEINDRDEFNAITSFLVRSTSGFSRVYITGTDVGHEGTWTRFSGEKLPFIQWGSGQPSKGVSHNCLELYKPSTTWAMADYDCHYEEPTTIRRFMCEVPS